MLTTADLIGRLSPEERAEWEANAEARAVARAGWAQARKARKAEKAAWTRRLVELALDGNTSREMAESLELNDRRLRRQLAAAFIPRCPPHRRVIAVSTSIRSMLLIRQLAQSAGVTNAQMADHLFEVALDGGFEATRRRLGKLAITRNGRRRVKGGSTGSSNLNPRDTRPAGVFSKLRNAQCRATGSILPSDPITDFPRWR